MEGGADGEAGSRPETGRLFRLKAGRESRLQAGLDRVECPNLWFFWSCPCPRALTSATLVGVFRQPPNALASTHGDLAA